MWLSKQFNLEDYITVKQRKQMFYRDYPTGVIIPKIISDINKANEYVVIEASVWKERAYYQTGFPPDGKGMSLSRAGGGMADKFAWVENCEESAIGRALDNMGYAVDGKCSREEMEKVQYMSSVTQNKQEVHPKVEPGKPAPQKAQQQQQAQKQQPETPALTERPENKAPQETTQNAPLIKDGQKQGITKSLEFLASKGGPKMTVDEFLAEHMGINKPLDQLTASEAVQSMKKLNELLGQLS